ncbi:MAG TPA: universal stress protein [Streptomyces sp.]|jgi:nucleotide-binding universal stress UspA family protein|nr:universal stress protein [Streptomyces sp.]
MGAYETVLVGTDGSKSSLAAVDRAAAVAATNEARLVIVCAYRPARRQEVLAAHDALRDDAYQVVGSTPAEEVLRIARERAAAAGAIAGETVAVLGEPVPALTETARRVAAQLLVVGNRGLNTLTGRILGSVPAEVARRSGVDVLIVCTT